MKHIPYIYLFAGFLTLISCGSQKKVALEDHPAFLNESVTGKKSDRVTSLFIDANREKILGNYRQAMSLYNQCLSLDPNHAPSMYEMARLYQMQGAVNDALNLAEKSVRIDPENKWYNLMLASIYEQTGQFKKAIAIFETLQNIYPKELEYKYQVAMLYMRDDRFADAVAVFDKIERIVGPDEDLIIQKQKLYLLTGQTDRAIAELEKLITMNPGESRFYALLTELYLDIGNYPKAIETLEKIRELDPQNPYIHITLAEYHFKTGNEPKALEELKLGFANPNLDMDIKLQVLFNYYSDEDMRGSKNEQVLELAEILAAAHPNDARPFSLRADLLLRKEQYKEASEALRQAVRIDNSKFFMWETLLRLNAMLQDTLALRDESLQAIELFPLQPLPYLFAGLAYYLNQDYPEAIKKLNFGKDLVVDDDDMLVEFYMYLGDVYSKMKKHKDSDTAFDEALLLDPENAVVLNNYSYYLAIRNERLDDAEKMSAISIELSPGNKHYYDTYGWVMYRMGRYEEAKKWIEKSIENSASEDAVVLEHLGDVLYKLGNKEEALKYWKQALELGDGITEFLERKIKDGKLYE